jgi:ABC-type Fe3+ transport system permease subunit
MYALNDLDTGTLIALVIGIIAVWIVYRLAFPGRKK